MTVHFVRETAKTKSAHWVLYFTSWNYIIVTTYFVTAFVQSLRYYQHVNDVQSNPAMNNHVVPSLNQWMMVNKSNDNITSSNNNNPTMLSAEDYFLWIVYDITITMCPIVVIIFWLTLDTTKDDANHITFGMNIDTFFTIDRHGIISCLVLLEFFFQQNPYRILHFYLPCLFMLVYIGSTLTYWIFTGVTVYSNLDYKDSSKSSVAKAAALIVKTAVLLLVTSVYHLSFYFIDVLKKTYLSNNSRI